MSRYNEGIFAFKNRQRILGVVACAWLFLLTLGLGVALSASSEFKVSVVVAESIGVGVGRAALEGAATPDGADVTIKAVAGNGGGSRSGAVKGQEGRSHGQVVVSVSKL